MFSINSVYHERMRLNAQNQRDWADQQRREHQAQAAADREEEKNYADQEEAILRMRGMLEDENAARKAAYHRAIVEENKRMAQQKRDREAAWKNANEASNQFEVTLTNHNEQLQANGRTLRNDNWTNQN